MGMVKEKLTEETVKLKAMTFKEKRGYIWEYYKFHIIITVFLLFILGSLVNSWFINPPKKDYVLFAWMSGFVSDEQLNALSETLTEALVEDAKRETVSALTFYTSDSAEYNMAVYNRLVAMLSTGELDIFIMDRGALEDMAFSGYLAPLDELLALLPDSFAPLVTQADYKPEEDAVTETHDFGINLTDCPLFTSLGIQSEDMYLGVSVSSKNVPNIAQALLKMYE